MALATATSAERDPKDVFYLIAFDSESRYSAASSARHDLDLAEQGAGRSLAEPCSHKSKNTEELCVCFTGAHTSPCQSRLNFHRFLLHLHVVFKFLLWILPSARPKF